MTFRVVWPANTSEVQWTSWRASALNLAQYVRASDVSFRFLPSGVNWEGAGASTLTNAGLGCDAPVDPTNPTRLHLQPRRLGTKFPGGYQTGTRFHGLAFASPSLITTVHLLSSRDAARILGIRESTLTDLRKKGFVRQSTHERSGDQHGVFRAEDLQQANKALTELRWLATVSPESWNLLIADSLDYTLLASRHEKPSELLRPGNWIVFYMSRRSGFIGAAEVAARREITRTVWPTGAFKYRIPLRRQFIVPESALVPVQPLLKTLGFIRNRESWEAYFRGAIRMIPGVDFDIIQGALRAAAP